MADRKKNLGENVVLVFQSMRFKSGRDMIAGVYRYARQRRWQIQCFDSLPSSRKLKDLLETWRPIGCLVAVSLLGGRPAPSFGKTPVVFLGRMTGHILNVVHDSFATSELAADELARINPASWCYFGPADNPVWSRIRRRGYAKSVAGRGGTCQVFRWNGLNPNTPDFHKAIRDWLLRIRRPIAMFIAADYLAGMVIDAAKRLELRIPEDIALVSVDNDEQICENLSPSLSSVAPDFEGAGYAMGELLFRRIENPSLNAETYTYGPVRLVRRASSRPPIGSNRLVRALEFIRTHVGDPIGVSDVALHLGLQRRSVERLFKAETGKGVLAAIQSARLEQVKFLLRERRNSLTGMAARVGFSSEGHLKTLFKRKTGMTMSEWRISSCP